ncbi:MAG: ABC transporter substrate-binding protein [Burkholderiales bacterium]
MSTRREFLRHAALAAAAGALGPMSEALAAEPPPETKRIRIGHTRIGTCWAPQYIAEEMLRTEGFTEVRYVPVTGSEQVYPALAAGELDVSMAFIAPFIVKADSGAAVVVLAGIHPGCIELFGSERIRTLRDLKGRKASIVALNSSPHAFIASMMTHVGMDAQRDIQWVVQPKRDEAVRDLAESRIDALIVSPPFSYEMRTKKVGHVVVNMTTDRPWSQYFCCMLAANRDFLRKNPVAAKRVLRAVLKGANLCAGSPEPAARSLADRGFAPSYAAALQTLREVPYARWREYDHEDTVRFYALRLQEAGMIKSNPKRIIEQATDFRFLNELKKELKA